MEAATSGKCTDKTRGGIRGPALTTTYRFNKIIATATSRFIVTVAIVVYKGLILVVYQMLTSFRRQRYFDIYCDGNAVDTDTVSKSVKTIKYKALLIHLNEKKLE